MGANEIEDILISRDYNKKKKKPKGFFVIFFILFLILAFFVGAYWYLTRDIISSKELFVQNISKININKLLNNEIYTNLVSRLQKESSQINTSLKLTTDIENEEIQDIDVTKFELNISNSNDIVNKKSYAEAILKYSGNDVFKVDLAASENDIALNSNEILDKYVGIHQDKIKEVFGIDMNLNEIKELNSLENTNFTENELNEYLKKYFEIALNNISEDKFSVQENIAIANAVEDVEVTNYSITLSQDDLNAILIQILEEVKNDEELINKLIIKTNEVEKTEENQDAVITPSDNQDNNIEDNQTSDNPVEGESDTQTDSEEELKPEIPVIQINPVGTISVSTSNTVSETIENENIVSQQSEIETVENEEQVETIETTDIEELIKQEYTIEEQILKIVLGKKLNLNQKQFVDFIDEIIKEINRFSGDGIKINVYASNEAVEKINLVLPNSNIIEIDFYPDENQELNSNQSYIKLTYLTKNENEEKNGFSLEINKEQSNASTKIDSEYSFIENEKINKKIKVNLKTEGTTNSKEIKNDIVITLSTNKSETQVAMDNTIKFTEVTDLPGLNSENCIYLDLLPENERNDLLNTIKSQILTLYTNKKENLNFIDTNTYSQTTLENQNANTNKTTREDAKNALINKVVSMMDAAIANNEEFTIQNLRDLKIDGYKVSSAVTSEAALIVVDVYKFSIDTSFTLTDVE